jgi:tetratricopeptide (TPR) repeat protein
MSDNFTINEPLHRYFDGELTGSEAIAFEAELAQNPGLRQQLEDLGMARYGLRQWALQNRIASLHKEMMPQVQQEVAAPATMQLNIVKKSKWWLVAASVAAVGILVLFLSVLMQKNNNGAATAADLYASTYTVYDAGTVRGTETAMQKAYSQKQYQQVLGLFAQEKAPGVNEQFYAACAYLETGDAAAAAGLYKNILQLNAATPAAGYKEDAEYFLGLAYLKQNNITAARPLFEAILSNPQHLYHDKITADFMKRFTSIAPSK